MDLWIYDTLSQNIQQILSKDLSSEIKKITVTQTNISISI